MKKGEVIVKKENSLVITVHLAISCVACRCVVILIDDAWMVNDQIEN